MGMKNMNTGIITPWTEHFYKGYNLNLITTKITDAHIIKAMDSVIAYCLNPISIRSCDKFTEKGTRYKSYEGDPQLFNSTHWHAIGISIDVIFEVLDKNLYRAFQNDDSDEAEMFHRHVVKVVSEHSIKVFASDEYKAKHKTLENKLNELNSIGWEIMRKEYDK
jgi:hypothetical protein